MKGHVADLFRAIKLKSYQVQMVVEGLSLRFFSSFEKISSAYSFYFPGKGVYTTKCKKRVVMLEKGFSRYSKLSASIIDRIEEKTRVSKRRWAISVRIENG